jgi:hypothetical protein
MAEMSHTTLSLLARSNYVGASERKTEGPLDPALSREPERKTWRFIDEVSKIFGAV